MFLHSIQLTNFRNFKQGNYAFKTPTTVLFGNNAQGKTNFLESIFFLATTKSFKGHTDQELINNGSDTTTVSGTVADGLSLSIAMQRREENLIKITKVSGISRRISNYIGNFYAVAFTPWDINLVTGSPSLRRWHIDLTLAQIDKEYKHSLTSYEQIVKRRNKLLKLIREGKASVSELDYWSDKQIEYGKFIQNKRQHFFDFLNSTATHTEDKNSKFEFEYIQNPLEADRMASLKQREIYAAASLCGPHREDFSFLIKDSSGKKDLSLYGSRGEQRSAVFNLKLSEVSFFEATTKTRPVLLLDDVFSELDTSHKQAIINLIPLQQTILTTIEVNNALFKSLRDASFVLAQNGQLHEIPDMSLKLKIP